MSDRVRIGDARVGDLMTRDVACVAADMNLLAPP
jgi:hypothetical protein